MRIRAKIKLDHSDYLLSTVTSGEEGFEVALLSVKTDQIVRLVVSDSMLTKGELNLSSPFVNNEKPDQFSRKMKLP